MKIVNQVTEQIVIFHKNGISFDLDITKNISPYNNEKLTDDFKKKPYKTLFYFGLKEKNIQMSESLYFLHKITRAFIKKLSNNPDIELTRIALPFDKDDILSILSSIPFVIGTENITNQWLIDFSNELLSAFKIEIDEFEGTVQQFLTSHNEQINIVGRVFFHLVENKSDDYPFAFLATYSSGNIKDKKVSHVPLKNALTEYKDQQELLSLLSTVSKAADKSDFISELVESGELFSPLRFDASDAYIFLKEIPLYEQSGILCRIPNWWKTKSTSVKVSVTIGETAPSKVGMDAILSFKPDFYFGDIKITREEVEQLLNETSGLSLIKGKWIEVDHDKLQQALDAFEKATSYDDFTLSEAMKLQKSNPLSDNDIVEINNGEWLNNIKKSLLNPELIENLNPGANFKAELRHYQQTGMDWLAMMKKLGFGAMLADDMGLGKTIQILALLEYLHNLSSFKALLIIPTSLIGNWQNEIEKFAPKLKYYVLHSKNTTIDLATADLFITTYGMALKLANIKEHKWDLLILDEAQAIKNPDTKRTKAIKEIDSSFKIAMTGTPVENRLADLWSLFDFLNAGLLGTKKEFGTFIKNIQSEDSYVKLRNVVNPFILRRLKTDKSIISDLPDKIEIKAYTTITKKQLMLYNDLIKQLKFDLEVAEGIARKGLVLSSILKFKQICNHPDQYLGQETFDHRDSGKFEKLREICETIYEKRERVLIFTQFREMTKHIKDYLDTIFNREGLVLHGGTSVAKRTKLVDEFNADEYVPFMVLSLKAGGVGLNLTSANHVIHFDRWWNPAVENQATDRAFRIGQNKNVIVHKFITKGTIEEKIDLMIEDKQKLAGDLIVATGENWITEMSNNELIKLFSIV